MTVRELTIRVMTVRVMTVRVMTVRVMTVPVAAHTQYLISFNSEKNRHFLRQLLLPT